MSDVRHISRICARCGTQLAAEAVACHWCGTPTSVPGAPARLRVRKKRGVLKAYAEHIRRHWIYFVLAILLALVSAWVLINYFRRPSQQIGATHGSYVGCSVQAPASG